MRRVVFTAVWLLLSVFVSARMSPGGETTTGVDPTTWARLEYVNLWTSAAPMPFPLVTTGDVAGAGRLNAPNTQVLLGDGPLSTGSFPAARFTIGKWFDFDENFGAEWTIMATGLRTGHFHAGSDANGSPLLAIPFADVTHGPPQESSLVISQPGVRHGSVSAEDVSGLATMELDGLIELSDWLPGDMYRTTVVAGIRSLYLRERFQFDSMTTDMSGATVGYNDIFMDKNYFFGGDFGLRTSRRFKRLTVELTGKAGIGLTTQTQYVTSQNGLRFYYPHMNYAARDGFFTQATNISYTYSRYAFSVVPSARLRLGYDLSDNLRLTCSYEAFLWMQLMRPSNQLDRQINLSQLSGPLVGAARPALPNRRSDFWAQGFTVGLQVNF